MKDIKYFKILTRYLKNMKGTIFMFALFTFSTYILQMIAPHLYSKILPSLIAGSFSDFVLFVLASHSIYITNYVIIQKARDHFFNIMQIKFMKGISKDLIYKSLSLPEKAYEEKGVGEIENRLLGDSGSLIGGTSQIFHVIGRVATAIYTIIVTIQISLLVAGELFLYGIVLVMLSKYYFPKIKNKQKEIREHQDSYSKSLIESLSGIREIKALGLKNKIKDILNAKVEETYESEKKIQRVN